MPDVSTILVPVSGGGLVFGIAVALRAHCENVRIVGVSMEKGAAMYESQKAGKPILVPEEKTLADSLSGGIGLNNLYTFALTRKLVDDIILVNEKEIAEAIRFAYWSESQVIEGSGSVGLAAVLSEKFVPKGKTVILLSGSNIDMTLHHRIISGENVDVTKEV